LRLLTLAALLAASPALGESDIAALTPAERAAFGAEVRALLLAEPEIVQAAMNPPAPDVYGDAARADIVLLESIAPQVLEGADIALFTGPDCPDCEAAVAELDAISKASGATFIHHDATDGAMSKLIALLEMDVLPFYIMSDRVLRGHMPAVVLERYLTKP
jgi:hypothetical protein